MLSKEKFKSLCGYDLPDWQAAVRDYLINHVAKE
jgi:hypothetical protein